MYIKRLFFLLICTVLFAINISSQNAFEGYEWKLLEPSGEAVGRHENAFFEYKGKFYLLGGRGVKPVNVYDPATNSWETKGKTPFEIHHFQAVVYQDAVYFVGAMTGKYPKETPLENIWMYYPEKDEWKKGDMIPEEMRRGGAGAVLYQDKIYIIAGIELGHTSGCSNRFDCYDLKTGEWQGMTKAPHVRDHFAAVLYKDKIYCMGGRNTSVHHPNNFAAFFAATVPQVDVYDLVENKWVTLKEDLPVPTAAGGTVLVGNSILYFGGETGQDKAHNETFRLNLDTHQWTELMPLKIGRHGSAAVFYKDKVYIAAGSPNRGGGNMNSIEVFSKE
ncbi:Kelch repeat-containing protein [Labilibacter marinus]|uniref:Kelch repeat-containing protein n=1 Tax=Labilibacter marinus TaxID=1477105 RepID=UPI00082C3392|nr:kelch repeat-containing protein [Labilibacter marinus]